MKTKSKSKKVKAKTRKPVEKAKSKAVKASKKESTIELLKPTKQVNGLGGTMKFFRTY